MGRKKKICTRPAKICSRIRFQDNERISINFITVYSVTLLVRKKGAATIYGSRQSVRVLNTITYRQVGDGEDILHIDTEICMFLWVLK